MNDETSVSGYRRLLDPVLNKSTAFSAEEREHYRLRGLLPPRQLTLQQQEQRVMANIRRKTSALEKFIFLQSLHNRNETLFFYVLTRHIEEMMPIVYTPTVGQACLEFADIFREPRGLYVTARDRGRVATLLQNWPTREVAIVVVTDGERILGLGDLGANGMGIPIGKLALYVACAGLKPRYCLPILIDVGTENRALRANPFYLGLDQDRLRGAAYDALLDELVDACRQTFPGVLIQFEDFATVNAYRLLNRYRQTTLCFNDDIQGTAAVALAGLYAAARKVRIPLVQSKIMFLGAGSAATGIADLIVPALMAEGLSEESARRQLWFCNSRGLITSQTTGLAAHNLPYAHDHAAMSFHQALADIQPSVLIGATGRANAFDREALAAMARYNTQPIIFALSNPTANAECTAEQAYQWTEGRCVFASGSPFSPVYYDGHWYRTGQGNNAYVFPGLGLGVLASAARRISDGMLLACARALAEEVSAADLAGGAIYPPLNAIRQVSLSIAVAVAEQAQREGLCANTSEDWRPVIAQRMYEPCY